MDELRESALDHAEEWLGQKDPRPSVRVLLDAAEEMFGFLAGNPLAVIQIRVGLVREQADGNPSPVQPEGPLMQLRDTQQVTYTLAGKDAKGFDVSGEQFTAVSLDEAVVTVTQDGDTFTAVAGAPGSAIVTFSEAASGLSATEAIDVVPGDLATIDVVAGDVTEQPVP
jgi:hypothetical protein